MEKRNEKKALVCALCLGLACSSNLGMLNIHAVETKAPETVATKSDETQETWVNLDGFSAVLQNAIKRGYSNKIKDGKVNVEAISSLEIEKETITNLDEGLKGIEKLHQLKSLTISACKNLDGEVILPKIESLETLVISDCGITNINLENLPNLINLNVGGNKLESIDLENNKELSYLNASYNKFKSLDLSSYPEIARLDIQHNQLESINLNNNEKLGTLSVSFNNLSDLDVSKCVNLTTLNVDNNPLTVLDISNNTKLKTVNAFNTGKKGLLKEIKLGSEYPNLTEFTFYNNSVESFDFNKLTSKSIITVEGYYNKLKYADLSGIQSRKTSTSFYLSGNNLLGYDLGENFNGTLDITGQLPTDVEMNEKGEVNLADYGLTTKDFKNVKNVNGKCDYNSETGVFSNIKDTEITYDFESSGKSMNVTMYVTQKINENSWVKEPSIADCDILSGAKPTAEAKYGDVVFKYGKDDKTFDYDEPNSVGTWYMKAYVYKGENYTGLESKPIKFEVTKATGSVSITFKKEWLEGETPNKPEITSKTYDESQIHVAYRKKDSNEKFDTIPTTVGTYELIVTCDENEYYYGKEIKREFTIKKQTQEEINMVVNIGDHDYFSLSTLGIELTPENETEIKESLEGATYENGKFININGNVVTFHYTLGNTICNYNLEIVRNSNQPVIVTMDIKAETDKDGNIYLKDLNLKNYKDEYASDIKYSCAGARFDNGKFYGFVNDKFIFAYNVNDKLTYQYRVTITKDNTVVAPDVKPEEPTNPVKPTKPTETKPAENKDKPKDAVVKDTSKTSQDHTAGLMMGFITLAGAIIVTNKKHEKE